MIDIAVQEAEMGVAGGVPREQRPMPFAGGAGRTAGPVTIYVANKAGNTVTPIRAASNRTGRPIGVGPGPELIAIRPDGQTAYVVGVGSLRPEAAAPVTLTAIRTATNRPGRVITVCASENLSEVIGPYANAVTPDSRTVYVSCAGTVVPVRAGADTASGPLSPRFMPPLALAAATAIGTTAAESRAWTDVAGTKFSAGDP